MGPVKKQKNVGWEGTTYREVAYRFDENPCIILFLFFPSFIRNKLKKSPLLLTKTDVDYGG